MSSEEKGSRADGHAAPGGAAKKVSKAQQRNHLKVLKQMAGKTVPGGEGAWAVDGIDGKRESLAV